VFVELRLLAAGLNEVSRGVWCSRSWDVGFARVLPIRCRLNCDLNAGASRIARCYQPVRLRRKGPRAANSKPLARPVARGKTRSGASLDGVSRRCGRGLRLAPRNQRPQSEPFVQHSARLSACYDRRTVPFPAALSRLGLATVPNCTELRQPWLRSWSKLHGVGPADGTKKIVPCWFLSNWVWGYPI
jgi:hypothetical protein